MFSLRTHAIITGALFGAIIAMAVAGNALHASGWLADLSAAQAAAKYIFFGLFLAFAYSTIPLMVKLVLAGQVKIGNANQPIIRAMLAHQGGIVLGFWTLISLGLALAVPAAIEDGLFRPDPAVVIAATPARGTLTVAPGMTVEEMHKRSSLTIKGKPDSVFADGNLFDFEIAGTGIRFTRCRYYFMTTSSRDRTHIANISVGTAQSKMSRAQLAGEDVALREQLAADGWLTGYEKTRTELERRFHGGAAGRASGNIWLKGDTVLRIMSRRLDDEKPGENAATAGEWIQFVELSTRQNYSGIERYEFAKP